MGVAEKLEKLKTEKNTDLRIGVGAGSKYCILAIKVRLVS
jgi:hypothetical protein